MDLHRDVTDDVIQALKRAQDEARSLGHGYIGTEHLLIVFADQPGAAGDAVRASGLSGELIRGEVARIFDENTWTRYVPDEEALAAVGVDAAEVKAHAEAEFGPGAVQMGVGNPGFTRRAHSIVERAIARAQNESRDRATSGDVLTILLDEADSIGVKVLERLGADLVALRAAVTS